MMKSLIMLALVLLMAGAISPRGQVRVTNTEELVREIEGKLTAALLQGDSASVDAILANDYIEIDAQGIVRNKSDVMASVRARASAPHSKSLGPEISMDETKLRTYGDTVILTYLQTTRYRHMENQALPPSAPLSAQTATYSERFMKVYSRLNGRWQLVAFQTTAIAKH